MVLHAPPDMGQGCGHEPVHSLSEAKRVSGCHEDCHPERPHRIAAMYQYLQDIGLAERCIAVAGTEVTQDQVVRVHSLPHWEAVQATRQRARDEGGGGRSAATRISIGRRRCVRGWRPGRCWMCAGG